MLFVSLPFARFFAALTLRHLSLLAHACKSHNAHRFQAEDPHDAWLQQEWGETLFALGADRASEAAVHVEVAAMLFVDALDKLAAAPAPGGAVPASKVRSLKRSGVAADQAEVREAAVTALRRLVNTLPVPAQRRCTLLQRLCHLQLQAVANQERGGEEDSGNHGMRREALACLQRLYEEPKCAAEASQLRQVMGGGGALMN